MELVIDIVIPVFLVIFAGWFSCKRGGLPSSAVKALNYYVLHFAVPPMLFLATAKVSFSQIVNPEFIAAFFITSLLTMAIGVWSYRGLKHEGALDATVIALICGWGNTIYMGVPLAFYLFGEKGTLPVIIATLSTNLVFIIGLSFFSSLSNGGSRWQGMKNTFGKMFFKNPVLMAPVLGGICSYYQIPIPDAVNNLFSILAPSAAPVALFALGMSLVDLNLQGNRSQLTWVTFIKIVVNPLIAVLVVYLMELEPFWAASVVLMSALPTGSMVFIFAKQYEKRVALTSSAIMSTTVLSLFSLAIVLPLLQQWVEG